MDLSIITRRFLGNEKHSRDVVFLLISRARAASTAWCRFVAVNGFDEELYERWIKNIAGEVKFATNVIQTAEQHGIEISCPCAYVRFAASVQCGDTIIFMPTPGTGPSRILDNYYQPWWRGLSLGTYYVYDAWSWEEAIDIYVSEMNMPSEIELGTSFAEQLGELNIHIERLSIAKDLHDELT